MYRTDLFPDDPRLDSAEMSAHFFSQEAGKVIGRAIPSATRHFIAVHLDDGVLNLRNAVSESCAPNDWENERTWIRASEAEAIVRAINLELEDKKDVVDRNEAERVVDI
jgi:hypothetical protein